MRSRSGVLCSVAMAAKWSFFEDPLVADLGPWQVLESINSDRLEFQCLGCDWESLKACRKARWIAARQDMTISREPRKLNFFQAGELLEFITQPDQEGSTCGFHRQTYGFFIMTIEKSRSWPLHPVLSNISRAILCLTPMFDLHPFLEASWTTCPSCSQLPKIHEFHSSQNIEQPRNGYLRVRPESEESLRVLVANLHKTQPLILEEKCWGGFFLGCNSTSQVGL